MALVLGFQIYLKKCSSREKRCYMMDGSRCLLLMLDSGTSVLHLSHTGPSSVSPLLEVPFTIEAILRDDS